MFSEVNKSAAREQISFITPHVNVLPGAEAFDPGDAVEPFAGIVDEILLQSLADDTLITYPTADTARYEITHPDMSSITICATAIKTHLGGIETTVYSLDLVEMTNDRREGNLYRYACLPPKGEVIRTDCRPPTPDERRAALLQWEQRKAMSEAEFDEAQDRDAYETHQAIALERELGTNHLPVRPSEIEHLGALIHTVLFKS